MIPMKKQILVLLFIVLLSATLFLFFKGEPNSVIVDGKEILVEAVDTPEARSRGLMFRDQLCEGCGMLFVFDQEDYHSFWMKNTRLSLDIVFISSDLEVVGLVHAHPCLEEPCQLYKPGEPCLYVLETNMGYFNETIIGKKVSLS